jgi:hypothetical protein
MRSTTRAAKQVTTLLSALLLVSPATAQTGPSPSSTANASQTARLLGLDPLFEKLASLRTQRACNAPASLEELTARQELLETVQKTALDVDGVLAEIASEQGQLSDLRATLQARRDKTVGRLNTAALITGSGAGTAISATQFTSLGSLTNNIGDGLGVGAGAASTILAILANRKQNGPSAAVGEVPNMLAPLFDGSPVLNTFYPPAILDYLRAVPAGQDEARGTRLEQLKAQWVAAGRLDPSGSKRQQEIAAVTSSATPTVKVSIQDLTTRIAMLVDVAGRVSLLKRDLSTLMFSYMAKPSSCPAE